MELGEGSLNYVCSRIFFLSVLFYFIFIAIDIILIKNTLDYQLFCEFVNFICFMRFSILSLFPKHGICESVCEILLHVYYPISKSE